MNGKKDIKEIEITFEITYTTSSLKMIASFFNAVLYYICDKSYTR